MFLFSKGIYGNLTALSHQPLDALIAVGSTMVGTGLTMEAIEQNPVVYEFMAGMCMCMSFYMRSKVGAYVCICACTMVGNGLIMEAIEQNPVVYKLLAGMCMCMCIYMRGKVFKRCCRQACMRARVRACVCAACVCACVRACVRCYFFISFYSIQKWACVRSLRMFSRGCAPMHSDATAPTGTCILT